MKNIKYLLTIGFIVTLLSCSDFINETDFKGSSTKPYNIEELQLMLNNSQSISMSRLNEVMFFSDDFYELHLNESGHPFDEFGDEGKTHANALKFNDYLWVDEGNNSGYAKLYQVINTAHVILGSINDVKGTEDEKAIVRGRALANKASALFELVNAYALHYSEDYANEEESGVVLPPDGGITYELKRATIQEVYDKIVDDLELAVTLLPAETPEYNDQINKQAAYALLAKVYLYMGNWQKAEENATLALAIYNFLYDYKSDVFGMNFPHFNQIDDREIVFFQSDARTLFNMFPNVEASPDLLNLYEAGDLRRTALFIDNLYVGRYGSFGLFSGGRSNTNGISVPELYLIKAEANARTGNTQLALDDLNLLRISRFTAFDYNDLTDTGRALQYVKEERRREMPFVQWRLMDIKRYNLIDNANISITHVETGTNTTYTLSPGDNNWLLPIPQEVYKHLGESIKQNPRDGNNN